NKDWVQKTFGTEAASLFRKEIDTQNPRRSVYENRGKMVAVILLSILPFFVALFILVGGIIPNEANIMKEEEFTKEMKESGFSLKKNTNRIFFDQAKTAQIAKDPDNSIEFYTFGESEQANDSFLKTKELLKEKEPDLFDQNG